MKTGRNIIHKLFVFVLVLAIFIPGGLYARKFSPKKLDKDIRTMVEVMKPVGLAVAVVKDGKIIFSKGYGVKDVETKEKITPETLFNIASCSKAFTTASLGILVQEGKLEWDDKVIDYLPDFQLSDPWITNHLTIRDLVSHRVGLGTFDGDLLWYETDYDDKEIIRRMRFLPIRRQFRSQFGYQNNTYITAGEIIKKISGKSWAEFVTEKVLQPLEMTTTRVGGKFLAKDADLAQPHYKNKKYPRIVQKPNAAASLFSSVDQLTHWMRMLLDNGKWGDKRLLESRTLRDLFSPQTPQRVSGFQEKRGTWFRAYAMGWGVSNYYSEKVVEHSGGMPGYISMVTLVPNQNLGIVTLTNNMNRIPMIVKYLVMDQFIRHPGKHDWVKLAMDFHKRGLEGEGKRLKKRLEKRVKDTRPSLDLEKYAGSYNDQWYGDASIEFKEGKLILTLLPTREIFTSPMEHWHYDTFRVDFKDEFLPFGLITFSFDSNGNITGFKIDLPNPDFHFHQMDFKKLKQNKTK